MMSEQGPEGTPRSGVDNPFYKSKTQRFGQRTSTQTAHAYQCWTSTRQKRWRVGGTRHNNGQWTQSKRGVTWKLEAKKRYTQELQEKREGSNAYTFCCRSKEKSVPVTHHNTNKPSRHLPSFTPPNSTNASASPQEVEICLEQFVATPSEGLEVTSKGRAKLGKAAEKLGRQETMRDRCARAQPSPVFPRPVYATAVVTNEPGVGFLLTSQTSCRQFFCPEDSHCVATQFSGSVTKTFEVLEHDDAEDEHELCSVVFGGRLLHYNPFRPLALKTSRIAVLQLEAQWQRCALGELTGEVR